MVARSGSKSQAIYSNSRKRQLKQLEEGELEHSCPKRREIRHPTFSPPELYENLSTKYLEKNALRALSAKIPEINAVVTEPVKSPPLRPYLPYFGRTRHSASQLSDVAQHVECEGPPDLSDLRGYRAPTLPYSSAMESSQSSLGRRKRGSFKKTSRSPSKSHGTTTSTSTKSAGPYDRSFLQHLIDHGILPPDYEYEDGRLPPKAENLALIDHVLGKQVEELSPAQVSDADFRHFQRENSHATKERQVMSAIIPIIEGKIQDPRCVCGEIPFTNLDHLTNGWLVAGVPDRCFGSRPESLKRSIRNRLSHSICPFTQEDLPILPNFFLEVKGPDGSAAVAERQLLYVMSLGERGYLRLLSHGSPRPIYDSKAHTLGFSYLSGQLNAYACHAVPPSTPKGRPTFVMTLVNSWSVKGNREQFCKGASAYRNGITWAKALRDKVNKEANQKATSLGSSVLLRCVR